MFIFTRILSILSEDRDWKSKLLSDETIPRGAGMCGTWGNYPHQVLTEFSFFYSHSSSKIVSLEKLMISFDLNISINSINMGLYPFQFLNAPVPLTFICILQLKNLHLCIYPRIIYLLCRWAILVSFPMTKAFFPWFNYVV